MDNGPHILWHAGYDEKQGSAEDTDVKSTGHDQPQQALPLVYRFVLHDTKSVVVWTVWARAFSLALRASITSLPATRSQLQTSQ